MGERHNGKGITGMHDSIGNATGDKATEYDGTGTRHDDNITGGKATDKLTGGKATDKHAGGKATNKLAGGKATDKLAGGKATNNVARYDGILLNFSKILMR